MASVMTTPGNDLGTFLRRSMSNAGVNQYDVADAAGRSQVWVSSILLRSPEKTLKRLWTNEPETFERIARVIKVRAADLLLALGIYADEATLEARAGMIPLERVVPVYLVGAGPALDVESAVGEVPIPRDVGDKFELFGLQAVDDSMSPYLRRGEIALVEADPRPPSPGKKVAVHLPDEGLTIRELVEVDTHGTLWLRTLNPAPGAPELARAPEGALLKGRVIKRLKDD
jgi:SOS-response transcriptional repressor LexA